MSYLIDEVPVDAVRQAAEESVEQDFVGRHERADIGLHLHLFLQFSYTTIKLKLSFCLFMIISS